MFNDEVVFYDAGEPVPVSVMADAHESSCSFALGWLMVKVARDCDIRDLSEGDAHEIVMGSDLLRVEYRSLSDGRIIACRRTLRLGRGIEGDVDCDYQCSYVQSGGDSCRHSRRG